MGTHLKRKKNIQKNRFRHILQHIVASKKFLASTVVVWQDVTVAIYIKKYKQLIVINVCHNNSYCVSSSTFPVWSSYILAWEYCFQIYNSYTISRKKVLLLLNSYLAKLVFFFRSVAMNVPPGKLWMSECKFVHTCLFHEFECLSNASWWSSFGADCFSFCGRFCLRVYDLVKCCHF